MSLSFSFGNEDGDYPSDDSQSSGSLLVSHSSDEDDLDFSSDSGFDPSELVARKKKVETPRPSITEVSEILEILKAEIEDMATDSKSTSSSSAAAIGIETGEFFGEESAVRSTTKVKHVKKRKDRDKFARYYVNQYMCYKQLGAGAFGHVVLAKSIVDGVKYALKVVNKSLLRRKRVFKGRGQKPGSMLENIFREIAILKALRHPNVVCLREVIDDPTNDKLFMILDYAAGGELLRVRDRVRAPHLCERLTDERRIRSHLRHILLGVDYLHRNDVIHADIKPDNILLTLETEQLTAAKGMPQISLFSSRKRKSVTEPSSDRPLAKPQLSDGSSHIEATDSKPLTIGRDSLVLEDTSSSSIPEPMDDAKADDSVEEILEIDEEKLEDFVEEIDDSKLQSEFGTCKIVDFGVSYVLNAKQKANSGFVAIAKGTPAFLAPECDCEEFSAYKIDIWALGVTLYMMAVGVCPFAADTIHETFDKIQTHEPPFPGYLSAELKSLLKRILDKNPESRPNMKQLFVDGFVTANGRLPLSQPPSVRRRPSVVDTITSKQVQDAISLTFEAEDAATERSAEARPPPADDVKGVMSRTSLPFIDKSELHAE